jgi:hypothetical protein
MSMSRRFTLPAHGAIEFLAGMAMMLAPVVFGFGAGGLLVSAALGAILTGVGLSLSTPHGWSAHAWHRNFDSVFLVSTALASLWMATAGQARAAIFLAAVVGVLASLTLATRYATRA